MGRCFLSRIGVASSWVSKPTQIAPRLRQSSISAGSGLGPDRTRPRQSLLRQCRPAQEQTHGDSGISLVHHDPVATLRRESKCLWSMATKKRVYISICRPVRSHMPTTEELIPLIRDLGEALLRIQISVSIAFRAGPICSTCAQGVMMTRSPEPRVPTGIMQLEGRRSSPDRGTCFWVVPDWWHAVDAANLHPKRPLHTLRYLTIRNFSAPVAR